MYTKICKRCGWVYPITQPGTKCGICGERFEYIVCKECGEIYKDITKSDRCPSCVAKRKAAKAAYNRYHSNASYARLNAAEDALLEHWLGKVKQVPSNYPTLTEAQWLEACNYFNGCARCASNEIDSRGFFIGRSLGGRYCDWNVIPLCTKCSKLWNVDKNVFRLARHKDMERNDKRYVPLAMSGNPRELRECLGNIVKYLEVKLDNAIRISKDPDVDAAGSKHNDN